MYASRRVERPTHAVVRDIETFLTRRGWDLLDGTGPSRTLAVHRTFRGVLRTGSGRRIARVELEVVPWSEHTSELGLRPIGSRARHAAARRAYGDAVAGLLDVLAHAPSRVPEPRRSPTWMRRAS